MKIHDLVNRRLIFVTGKGGVGKTCISASFGKLSGNQGKKTVIVEVDNFHPSLPAIFGKKSKYKPVQVEENLYICNITWRKSLRDWLIRTVKLNRIVKMIQSNKIAMLFLDATPGAREIVILSKIIELLDKFDTVIVDLPASGHALGILRVPGTAIQLMRSGPIHDRAQQILKVFSSPKTVVILSSLPEEMVVNETLEFRDKILKEIPQFRHIQLLLNRTAIPSLSSDEIDLLQRLRELDQDNPLMNEVLQAGIWEKDLEEATSEARRRLEEGLDESIFAFARFGLLGGFDGGMDKVIEQMTSSMLREVLIEASQ